MGSGGGGHTDHPKPTPHTARGRKKKPMSEFCWLICFFIGIQYSPTSFLLKGSFKKKTKQKQIDFESSLPLEKWIHNFGLEIPLRLRVTGFLILFSYNYTGSLQGCVLSPLLFVLYTNDCRNCHENRFLLVFPPSSSLLMILL